MIKGSCLCGAVAYELEEPLGEVHHCHCGICRKSHAAAFSTYGRIPRAAFRLVRGENRLRRFRSSPPCERTFCGECGSHLQFFFDGMPDTMWVPVATMDDAPPIDPSGHMFVGSKAPWHEINDGLPQWVEYPPTM